MDSYRPRASSRCVEVASAALAGVGRAAGIVARSGLRPVSGEVSAARIEACCTALRSSSYLVSWAVGIAVPVEAGIDTAAVGWACRSAGLVLGLALPAAFAAPFVQTRRSASQSCLVGRMIAGTAG